MKNGESPEKAEVTGQSVEKGTESRNSLQAELPVSQPLEEQVTSTDGIKFERTDTFMKSHNAQ
jgi:hypothetical protein